MPGTSTCPKCGKPIAANAPSGLCPECLMNAGADAGTQTGEPNPTREPPPPTAEIARLFPNLEIIELLGRGGMGAVYKARQPHLDRFVAVKILLRQSPTDEPATAFPERFAREARALAKLNHPNIVTVYDYGQAGPYAYLLMEYVDGMSLRDLLHNGHLRPSEALPVVPPICDALQFAHNHGIVHRDIKPENILLDKEGRVKIADFGIAKMLGADRRATLTGDRQSVGTPHYMAPEQVEHPASVDHRADIYSLGVVLYELLTGELPLGKFQPPSHKVRMDVRLDEVVLRALEKEPERRYQQANEVKTRLETIAETPAPRSLASRRFWPAAGILALGGVLVVAGLLIGEFLRRAPAPVTGGWDLKREVQMAKAGNQWAAYELWDAYYRGHHGVRANAANAEKWLNQFVQNVWLVHFEPVDDFAPAKAEDFLIQIHRYAQTFSGETNIGLASFFRTVKQGNKLVGSFLTDSPNELQEHLARVPHLKVTSVERISPSRFIVYESSEDQSLDD